MRREKSVRKERRRRPPHLSTVAIVYRAERRIRRGLGIEADFPPASRARNRRSPGLTLSSGFFLRGGGLISSGLDETQNDLMR